MPRYERLALEQNALEEAGWKSWRGGDPIGRIVSGLVMILLAVALTRLVRNPAVVVAYMGVVLVPLGPEIRALWHGWQYRRALQSIVDLFRENPDLILMLCHHSVCRIIFGAQPKPTFLRP